MMTPKERDALYGRRIMLVLGGWLVLLLDLLVVLTTWDFTELKDDWAGLVAVWNNEGDLYL